MTTETSVQGRKDPLRVISIAWGEKYVDDFLDFCLPALLAPGNLPVLAEHFSAELVFVTEERLFGSVYSHPAYKQAVNICPVRLISLDDLVATLGSYGMSITYAFFRGFEDLGPAMTDCYMVFVHADFILADGSYRGLLPHLLRGERLVFSPSYCAVSEEVMPLLLAAKDPVCSTISVPPRQMAEIALRHRHLSVRAKTVNQQFFSVDHIEQYYWAVDEHTLLVRQFPMALVAMKPERHLIELRSYWDYGVIADFCPSMKYAAISDSDDYLMLELRERDNPKGKLKLGWPSTDDIAKGLLAVITDYTLALGRARFTLHSRELPPDVGVSHEHLDGFVNKVLAKLPPNLPSHHDHLQWRIHYPRFHAAREAFLARGSGSPAEPSTAGAKHRYAIIENAASQEIAEAAEECLASMAGFREFCASRLSQTEADRFGSLLRGIMRYTGQKSRVEEEYTSLMAALNHQRFESPVNVGDIELRVEAIKRLVNDVDRSGSVVHENLREFLHINLERSRTLESELVGVVKTLQPQAGGAQISPFLPDVVNIGALHRWSYRMFGGPGEYRRWHWKYSSAFHARDIAYDYLVNGDKDVILIHAGNSLFRIPEAVRSIKEIPLETAHMNAQLREERNSGRQFDCCLIDANISTFGNLHQIYEQVRPVLRPGGKIIGIFLNPSLVDFGDVDLDFIKRAFPVCGPAKVVYSGNWASVVAFKLRKGLFSFAKYLRLPETISHAFGMTAAAPFAMIASLLESDRTLDDISHLPRKLTSVTVAINVG